MALGAIVGYLGVSVAAGSPGAGLLWFLGAVALLAYIRLVEEQEMVARFGQEYRGVSSPGAVHDSKAEIAQEKGVTDVLANTTQRRSPAVAAGRERARRALPGAARLA